MSKWQLVCFAPPRLHPVPQIFWQLIETSKPKSKLQNVHSNPTSDTYEGHNIKSWRANHDFLKIRSTWILQVVWTQVYWATTGFQSLNSSLDKCLNDWSSYVNALCLMLMLSVDDGSIKSNKHITCNTHKYTRIGWSLLKKIKSTA